MFLLSLDGKKPLLINVVLGSAKQDEGRSFCWDGIKYMVVLFLHWLHETGRCIVSDNWIESKLDHTLTECFPSHMLFVHVSTRHWSCSAKCILKHQKKLNLTTANSVRKRNQITKVFPEDSLFYTSKELFEFQMSWYNIFFLNISKAKHVKTTSITFCGIPVPTTSYVKLLQVSQMQSLKMRVQCI